MKKTFTINISGSIFHIDEDAYEKLRGYLQMLNRHFSQMEEGVEILQDIESRIAELFLEKMGEGQDVINDAWVDEIISRMGKPEDFMDAEAEEPKAEEAAAAPAKKIRRRLYRDPDNRVLGGVCSGLGAYFNIDPVILRVLFVLILFLGVGASLLVYLVLWIAVPKAKTTAQRLEMKGEEATVSNIQKSFRDEMKDMEESYNKFMHSPAYEKGYNRMSRFGDFVGDAFKVLLRVVTVLFGALLIMTGFLGLVGFMTSMVVGHSVFSTAPWFGHWGPGFSMPEIANYFISPGSFTIIMIAVAFLIGIPLLAILYIGTKIVFNYKSNNKLIFLSGLAVWLVALIVVISVSVGQVKEYSKRTTVSQSQVIDCANCQTLYLKLGEDHYKHRYQSKIDLQRMKVLSENGESVLLGSPRLDIEKGNTNEFVILIRKKSRGSSVEAARDHVEEIVYNITQKDSVVFFAPYYTLGEGKRWLDQELDITVKIPEGKSVFLDESMVEIIYDIENVSNTWDGDMVGKFWKMTELGLEEQK
ncbi:PspC domain-containing protein [Gaoshiqia sp. Z1-71]|uniref:PspC domain-containing protein n=1 Tax=Gaoshiqia hydrogeniformans TaxID=3290090 RepID=UPI003BF7E6C3